MNTFIEIIKENKKGIIKKAAIAGVTILGLVLVAKGLASKNADEDEVFYDSTEDTDGCSPESESE